MKYRKHSFLELLSNIVDNRGKTCPTAEEGIPLIATNCIKNDSLYPVFQKIRYVTQETYDSWFRGHPEKDDIIFVTKGSPGSVCWVDDPKEFCIAQDMVAIRANEKLIHSKYLLALLRDNNSQSRISNMHVGTLIPHFKKGDFGKLFFEIPDDLKFQKKIGDIYFNLALKIENNKETNLILKSLSQTIFKSWFINFDPVQAKIEAKIKGIDPQWAAMEVISGKSKEELEHLSEEKYQKLAFTASLFPDEFDESEYGRIPKGWKWMPLYSTAEYVNGSSFKAKDFSPEGSGIPIVKIAELKSGIGPNTKFTNEKIKEKYAIDNGSLLYSWSGSPETSLEVFKWFGGKGWLNQHIFLINTTSITQKVFVYNLLNHMKPVLIEVAKNKQTTGLGHVTVADMKRIHVAVPDENGFKVITEYLLPLYEMDSNNTLQSENLKEQSETLIPKLLSGELEIN